MIIVYPEQEGVVVSGDNYMAVFKIDFSSLCTLKTWNLNNPVFIPQKLPLSQLGYLIFWIFIFIYILDILDIYLHYYPKMFLVGGQQIAKRSSIAFGWGLIGTVLENSCSTGLLLWLYTRYQIFPSICFIILNLYYQRHKQIHDIC